MFAANPFQVVGSPGAFGAGDLVSGCRFDPLWFVLVAVAATAYLRARHRARGSGEPWAGRHTTAFLAGLVVIVVATMSGLASYSTTDATVHLVADTLLVMVAPILLALGAPLSLALLAGGSSFSARLAAVLRGRTVRVLANPVTGWVVLGGGLLAYFFSGLFPATVDHRAVAELVDVALVVVGCMFVWPAAGIDPLPRSASYPVRLVPLLLTLPYFMVLGMALESQPDPIAPGTTISQLHAGAEVFWSTGGLLGIVASIAVLVAWVGDEERAARRRDDVDEEEAAAQLALWRANREAVAMEEALAHAPLVRARPAPEATSTARPAPEATSTARPAPEAISTARPAPEAISTARPTPDAE